MTLWTILVPAAWIAVVVILAFGLINMMRGGSSSTSQKLMRYRVIAQLLAVVVLMVVLYLYGPGGA